MTDSKLEEPLKDFLERRQKKKRNERGDKLLQQHITDFFASQKDKFAGAKIDVQVTVKGDVDLLQPRKSSRPAFKSDVFHVKKEQSNLPLTVKSSKSDDDEDIIVMTMKKEVVEIQISDGENATVKSEVKSEVFDG